MDEVITDQELRRRLSVFNTVVPPITSSTRKLLLKKLVNLESGQADKNDASKSMPPPKPKTKAPPTNGTNDSILISSSAGKQSQHMKFDNTDSPSKSTHRLRHYRAPDPFDTSDSEVDTGSLGRSILPANPYIASSSPKSSERSLMNVSDWKSTATTDEEQLPYSSSPETRKSPIKQSKKQTEKIAPRFADSNKTPTESSVNRKLRPSSISKTSTHADQAIQRWKEKLMTQSQNKNDALNPTLFNSPSIPKKSSQYLWKNVHPVQNYRNPFKKNTQNIYFLLLFIGFFGIIFGLYFTSIQSSTVVLPPDILNSLCAKKHLQGPNCEAEQEKVQRLYNSLVSQVQDKYIKNQCDKSDIEPTVDTHTEFEYISTRENMQPREIEELIELFKIIAKTYSESPIGFDNSFKINVQPNLPILCAVKRIFSNMFYLVLWLGIVSLSVVGLYFVICYITAKGEKQKLEMNQLIENTIDLLKEQAQNRPNENYLPIIHIRDSLIPFNERQAKSKIWAQVVQYINEAESSIRSEVQEIDGEDFEVWRWVQPMSPGI